MQPAVFEFGDDLQPEPGTFGLGDPEAEDFLLTGQIDPDRQIHHLDPDVPLPDFDVDAVEVDDGVKRINGLSRTVCTKILTPLYPSLSKSFKRNRPSC